MKSPKGKENPFSDDKIVTELEKIKEDLDTLILDTAKEINSPTVRRILLKY